MAVSNSGNPHGFDPATTVTLGASSVRVTRLGLGAFWIGRDAAEAAAVVQRALAHGIRYFDTAPSYSKGGSEKLLGAALAHDDRDRYVVSTKVGRLLRPPDLPRRVTHAMLETVTGGADGRRALVGRARRVVSKIGTVARGVEPRTTTDPESAAGPRPPGAALAAICDYSYDGVMTSIEESLTRLGLDRIDVALIHDPDLHHGQAIRDGYRALDSLRADGTIGAIGVGMNRTEPLIRFASEGQFDAFLIAGRYSLLDQSAAEELFDVAVARNTSIILGGVFNGGLLADPDGRIDFNYQVASPERIAAARLLKVLCDRHGVPLKAAALQFSFAHPAVTTMLLGPSSVMELDENIEMLGLPIPLELWTDLENSGLLRAGLPRPASPGRSPAAAAAGA